MCVLLALSAHAAPGKLHPRVEAQGNAVLVNKRAALRFQALPGGGPPSQRARVVAERLREHALLGLSPSAIQARPAGQEWRLVIAGRGLLAVATRAEARAGHTTPKALALRWVKLLREAVAQPALLLKPGRIVVPVGETRTLAIGGYAEAPFVTHTPQGEGCVTIDCDSPGRRLIVRGERPGKAVVRVHSGADAATCVILVRRWAGRVPTDLSAEITATPSAPTDLVINAAAAALRRIPCEPGAFLRFLEPLRVRRSPRPGQSQTVTARVRLAGPDYLPVTGTARVRVFNRALPLHPAARLVYSNNPEHIRSYQTLTAGPLSADAPARLMFHHDNQMRRPIALAVTLANPTRHAVRVHLIPGFVPPGRDPGSVGYRAGKVFLRNWLKARGEICTVPPGSVLPLLVQRLERHQTASGIAQVALVDSSDEAARCVLRVSAEPMGATGFPSSILRRLDAWRYAPPRPLTAAELAALDGPADPFPLYGALRRVETEYICGQHWAFVPVGRPDAHAAPASAEEDRNNAGDYGVLYNIKVTLQNPLPTPQTVEVAFGAGGGPVMAVFAIAGRYLEVNEVRPPEQRPLAHFTLRPHETRIVTIQTVPLGGSTYPATVIIR
ncbi:MAG TPA: hypothetical protein VFB38_13945 [Chthonomonadaceae bacterium]|nr:hypothetical protein [Chthonomonadaceae bacterium]